MERKRAFEIFSEYVTSESLIKHSLAVEAAMRGCAEYFGEDIELWGACGLLHDIDFEKWPEEHPLKGAQILSETGFSPEFTDAVKGHSDTTGVSRKSLMSKCLYAVDQLSSFIVAVALVRPEQLTGMKYKSVNKKIKDKGFARAVDRENLNKGAEELGMDFQELTNIIIKALQKRQEELNAGKHSLL